MPSGSRRGLTGPPKPPLIPRLLLLAPAAAAVYWVVRSCATRYQIANRSMLPTLHPGDCLLANRLVFQLRQPRRGDLLLFRHAGSQQAEHVKRLLGLPGDEVAIRAGQLLINGTPVPEPYLLSPLTPGEDQLWLLGSDDFFLLGDNRAESRDSRHFGPVSRRLLLGSAWYRYWPPYARGRLRPQILLRQPPPFTR